METPLISVIVPAYNIEKYIVRCLDSIIAQTYKNLEIIVVDDGSGDSTGAIIDKYKEKDSRVIPIHKKNGGVSSARSCGLSVASGEYIGFVDGDDYIEPEMYEILIRNMMKYHTDISHCGYKMVFPDGHEDFYYGSGKLIEQNHRDGVRDLLRGDFVEPGLWNKLYHRSIVEGYKESSLWDETIRINEDLLMNYIFFSKAKSAIYEDLPLYYYILRIGSAATSNSRLYKLMDPKKVLESILVDVNEDAELYAIVAERYTRILLGIATQKIWRKEAQEACRLLRERYKEFSDLTDYSRQISMMAWLGGHMIVAYRIVRKLYDKVTKVGEKYKID